MSRLEQIRGLHEDVERLEAAIAERVDDQYPRPRDNLSRDHAIAYFAHRASDEAARLLELYRDGDGTLEAERRALTTGDPFESFYKQLAAAREHHAKYPNEPVENLEKAYRKNADGSSARFGPDIDLLFSGEEAYGRYLDMALLREDYANLPGVKDTTRMTYLHYLDNFDKLWPPECLIKKSDKMSEKYFTYVTSLSEYLESFLRRSRPLEDVDKMIAEFEAEFETMWNEHKVPGWTSDEPSKAKKGGVSEPQESVYCEACDKYFSTKGVYDGHLNGKKHKQNEKRKASGQANGTGEKNGVQNEASLKEKINIKERVIAQREFLVRKLAATMQDLRSNTRVNVERRQGMTERERELEIQALMEQETGPAGGRDPNQGDEEEEGSSAIYNPLKLPMAWDGKPIPFWLYKLHGLGNEFNCEICGNYIYMGRRAYDKHFIEPRHTYGLRALGIIPSPLFRDVTRIEDAKRLWEQQQSTKKAEKSQTDNVVQMEDAEGNVMPEKVYYDLQKQGLL
ncbi:hypothetical protein BDY21DRAFT_289369 [Lineolata rhizophorae]|uniref:Matrin-type domain-containing protein n=1 Tax=Lineolata rhizophorae TaxID=578093 RepID=A0A6A6NW23_9PEZI|nr:hypothetical protein BDY21DRAFT_289369 [Lineolata rhizophorae]